MKKITLLTLLLPCLFLNGYSVSLDSYLSYVEQKFDKSTSTEAKRYEVIKPLNIKYLSKVSSIEDIDESQLVVEDLGKISLISNALALAIASADIQKTQKFLQVIDDVNDNKLVSSGYRQLVGLPHIAVNPLRQLKIFDKQAKLDSDYVKRMLKIIDVLAQYDANFNMLNCENYYGYVYNNTPLVHAELVSSIYSFNSNLQYQLMTRAILYGADPELPGTTGRLTNYYKYNRDLKNLKPLILEYYAELSTDPIKFKKVKLAESVMANKEISDILKAIDKKRFNSSDHESTPKAVNKVSSQSDNESTQKAVTEVSSSWCSIL
ncbi:hypothetical protein [Francisella hispaniensis]|uniref:Uncharacterized protein n=1 Tax=Francisella hispaniensis FSC454 TaxID=1088883 RepID=A0AAC9NNA9_9GAMM|nr:hypothetical protein [Francisella hispaniensis]APD50410.1 hypothetical protein FSC454_04345 [Francisella hispaniensis FSC454]